MVTWKASVFIELQLVEQWAIHVRISSLMEEHIIGRVFKCGLKQDRKIDSKEADGMDTSLLNTTSDCEAFPSKTFCRPQAVILFSYLCAHLAWLWGKTDESSQSTSYKLNLCTTLVKNTILYCGSCLFWDHHCWNWFEIVQTFQRGSWQNQMHAHGLQFTM